MGMQPVGILCAGRDAPIQQATSPATPEAHIATEVWLARRADEEGEDEEVSGRSGAGSAQPNQIDLLARDPVSLRATSGNHGHDIEVERKLAARWRSNSMPHVSSMSPSTSNARFIPPTVTTAFAGSWSPSFSRPVATASRSSFQHIVDYFARRCDMSIAA